MTIEIQPFSNSIEAKLKIPGSKSYSNRALLIGALANGTSRLTGLLFSDDTDRMIEALRKLGVKLQIERENQQIEVVGNGGKIPVESAALHVGNAGTVARPILSYVSLGQGKFRIDGDEPMRKSRPMLPLLNSLRKLGVDIRSEFNNDFLPLTVHAKGLKGGSTRLNASKSSQFLTSLLMVAPVTKNGISIELEETLISKPYIDITIDTMKAFGAEVLNDNYRKFTVRGNQKYRSTDYRIEPDASSASYFFALAAVNGGRVRIENLSHRSAQGDVRFVEVLEQMGCRVNRQENSIELIGTGKLKGIEVDMNAISDTSLTLAAIAPFAKSKVSIRNIEHIRWQETDRISAMVTELRRLGVEVVEHDDALEIFPCAQILPAEIETYNDHRIAMSFSLVGTMVEGIKIKNPNCVAKTFPNFFEILNSCRKP